MRRRKGKRRKGYSGKKNSLKAWVTSLHDHDTRQANRLEKVSATYVPILCDETWIQPSRCRTRGIHTQRKYIGIETKLRNKWKERMEKELPKTFLSFFLYVFSFHFLSRVLVNSPVFLGFSSSFFFRQLRRSFVAVVAVVIDVAAAVAAAGVVVAVIAFVNDWMSYSSALFSFHSQDNNFISRDNRWTTTTAADGALKQIQIMKIGCDK